MKGDVKMKKSFVFLALAFFVVFSLSFNTFAVGYAFEEVNFSIPDYYIEQNNDSDETIRKWKTEDNGAEIVFKWVDNVDLMNVEDMEDTEAVSYYTDNMCSFPDDFVYDNSTLIINEDVDWWTINGNVLRGEEVVPCEMYMFSTDMYIYTLEFVIEDTDYYDSIEKVLSSLWVEGYSYSFDEFYYDDYDDSYDDEDEAFDFFITAFLVIIMTLCVKAKKKGKDKNSTDRNAGSSVNGKVTNATRESTKPKLNDTKFELNGKNVTQLNERFTADRSDSDFARKELERERKEREKMFK